MKKLITAGVIVFALLLSLAASAVTASDVPAVSETPAETEISAETETPVDAEESEKTVIYTDLSEDWYKSAAEKYGFPEIFADGTEFHPDRPITRVEFVRMLCRALDITVNYFAPTDISEYYTDMTNGDIGAREIYDMVTAGIIDRNLEGEFEPAEPLTREEMIHYIMNALNYVTDGKCPVLLIMPAPFADDASIDEAYRGDVTNAVILKLIQGRENNMLYPKDSTTRAEAVVVAERLIELVKRLVPEVEVTASAKVNNGTLEMSLVIENNGDNTVTIDHSYGKYYDFNVLDSSGEVLYTWVSDKVFITVMTSYEIKPGEKAEFTEVLGSEIFEPIKDKAAFVTAYIAGFSEDFEIDRNGYVTPIL